jgi:hypothetical protein
MVLCDRFVTAITEARSDTFPASFVRKAMTVREQMFALIAIGAGLAFTVGLWLLGLLIAGGINLL